MCSSPSLNCGPSGIWSTRDIPRNFVVKKMAPVRSETSYVPSQLRARVDRSRKQMKIRNLSVTELEIYICKMFKLEISSLSPASFFNVYTTFVSAPIMTVNISLLLILFLILLATTSSTSLSQLKFC